MAVLPKCVDETPTHRQIDWADIAFVLVLGVIMIAVKLAENVRACFAGASDYHERGGFHVNRGVYPFEGWP